MADKIVALQLKGTQETLNQLAKFDILSPEVVANLLNAYVFLRDVEHRLQYWDDQQTQILPEDSAQQILLAQSMGFESWNDFLSCLNTHRAFVHQQFNNILSEPEHQNPTNTSI